MADNEVNVGASAQLFAPIQPPRIKSISRKAVQDFLADREAYEDAISVQPGIVAVSYRSCFPAMFLKSLIRARMFGAEITQAGQLTDELIKQKLEKLSGRTSSVSVEAALADVKRNVKLDANESDARVRVLMLSASYLELCEKRGWKFVENSPKAAIQHIISVLQHPQLKTRMEDALKLEKADLKADYFGFMDFLADKAELFEEFQSLREYLQSRNKNRDTANKNDKKTGSGSSSANNSKESSTAGTSSGSSTKKTKSLPPCLNPKCSEQHLVKDCSITSKEQARKLLEE